MYNERMDGRTDKLTDGGYITDIVSECESKFTNIRWPACLWVVVYFFFYFFFILLLILMGAKKTKTALIHMETHTHTHTHAYILQAQRFNLRHGQPTTINQTKRYKRYVLVVPQRHCQHHHHHHYHYHNKTKGNNSDNNNSSYILLTAYVAVCLSVCLSICPSVVYVYGYPRNIPGCLVWLPLAFNATRSISGSACG